MKEKEGEKVRLRYHGMTRKQLKRITAKQKGSEAGSQKGETCHATSLDKAMAKYPRSYRIYPQEYIECNQKKDKAANRTNTFFTNL